MKRILLTICVLGIFACDSWKEVGVAGINPSPFVGNWVNAVENDSIKNLSLHIGERNDSLLVAFYWEREEPFFMTGNPLKDSKKQVCVALPKSGNKAVGHFNAGSRGTVTLELFSNSTMLFRSDAPIAAFPDSAVMVKASEKAPLFAE